MTGRTARPGRRSVPRGIDQCRRFRATPGDARHVLKRDAAEALNERSKPVRGSRVLILGVAYKPDVADPRESPSFVIMEQLLARGAEVEYNDPHVPRLPHMRRHSIDRASRPLTSELLAAQDCVIILTDHSAYDWRFIVEHSALVVDTRNATRHVIEHRERIVRA